MHASRRFIRCFLILAILTLAPLAVRAVTLTAAPGAWEIQAADYSASIDLGGRVSGLRIGGLDCLRPGEGFARCMTLVGTAGEVKFSGVNRLAPNTLEARGDAASIRYEFADSSMNCILNNNTTDTISLYMIVDPTVLRVARGENDTWLRMPITRKWTQASLYTAGHARMSLTGLTWQFVGVYGMDCWIATILPREQGHVIQFTFGAANSDEAARIDALLTPWRQDRDLVLLSPRNWQVFQRRTRLDGAILFSGRVEQPCDRLEYRLIGRSLSGPLHGKWEPIDFVGQSRGFNIDKPVPAGGWYKLELRAIRNGKPVLTKVIDNVGVGEVFVGAGQSNSTSCGQFHIAQSSGMVAATDGINWQPSADPQPGAHDGWFMGSFWPAFGDAMYEKYKVPIGVAVTGHGGTSVMHWEPEGELFNWTLTRIRQLGPGGFRALLWHQGESDVIGKNQNFYRQMKELIIAMKHDAGFDFPWFVAQVSYLNPQAPSDPLTRDAQKRLWDEGLAQEGPDTDTLTGDHRDFDGAGIHFSPKGLRAHGRMWADKVGIYLDRVLADEAGAQKGWRRLLFWRGKDEASIH